MASVEPCCSKCGEELDGEQLCCDECGENMCRECGNECPSCGCDVCDKCMIVCDICGRRRCGECTQYTGQLKYCEWCAGSPRVEQAKEKRAEDARLERWQKAVAG